MTEKERKPAKHSKPKRGFNTFSTTYKNQTPVLGGKGIIYTTRTIQW